LKVRSFAFFGNFAAGTLPSIFCIETGVPKKEKNFPVINGKKTGPTPKFCVQKYQMWWGTLMAMSSRKNIPKKAKDRTFNH
jgi:hypothetical protein